MNATARVVIFIIYLGLSANGATIVEYTSDTFNGRPLVTCNCTGLSLVTKIVCDTADNVTLTGCEAFDANNEIIPLASWSSIPIRDNQFYIEYTPVTLPLSTGTIIGIIGGVLLGIVVIVTIADATFRHTWNQCHRDHDQEEQPPVPKPPTTEIVNRLSAKTMVDDAVL